jgi:hypothetical protein
MSFHHNLDLTIKFMYSLILSEPQIDQKTSDWKKNEFRRWNYAEKYGHYWSICQNGMLFHQNCDVTIKFRYSLIMIYLQIDQKHQIWTKNEVRRWIYAVKYWQYWSICQKSPTSHLDIWKLFSISYPKVKLSLKLTVLKHDLLFYLF